MSFKQFQPNHVVIDAKSVTTPTFSSTPLITFNKSGAQEAQSGGRWLDIWDGDPEGPDSRIQFGIAHAKLDGNLDLTAGTPTEQLPKFSNIQFGNYSQYRALVLGSEEEFFNFDKEDDIKTAGEEFFIISLQRAQYKQKILPGSLKLRLKNKNTPTVEYIELTDNSSDTTAVENIDSGRRYRLIKTATTGTEGNTNSTSYSGSYGWLLPDIATILINVKALNAAVDVGGLGLGISNVATDLESFRASLTSFSLQSEETITSNFVHVYTDPQEFNYSTNPTFIQDNGTIRDPVLISEPVSYITSVGLYNNNNDLLAVAKLTKPLRKDFTIGPVIRIKLDY